MLAVAGFYVVAVTHPVDDATSDEPRQKAEERVKDPAAVALGRKATALL